MIARAIQQELEKALERQAAVALIGPRQVDGMFLRFPIQHRLKNLIFLSVFAP